MRRLIFSLIITACAAVSAPAFAQSMDSSSAMPTCASGDPVVWANTNTKKYHMQGDSYYGKTKHGKYLCKSAADAQSYKLAGSHGSKGSMNSGSMGSGSMGSGSMGSGSMGSGSMSSGSTMSPDSGPSPMASGMPMHKHHHHRKHGMMASPSPSMMPSPSN